MSDNLVLSLVTCISDSKLLQSGPLPAGRSIPRWCSTATATATASATQRTVSHRKTLDEIAKRNGRQQERDNYPRFASSLGMFYQRRR